MVQRLKLFRSRGGSWSIDSEARMEILPIEILRMSSSMFRLVALCF